MGKGLSVHIGVNEVDPEHYAGWSGPLNACEADAHDLSELAVDRGFASTVLLTTEATREAVIAAIEAATQELESGDTFFLSYSGHGGQVPDSSRDEPDGFDETWCLYDGQLLDDELAALWLRFAAGVRVLVLSDSCHSGTATRAPQLVSRDAMTGGAMADDLGVAGAAFRFMPRRAAIRTYRRNRAFYQHLQTERGDTADPTATVRLLSGCQDNQLSLDGNENGLFTATLLIIWDDGFFQGDYRQFHQAILEQMPPTQSPNHYVIGPPNPEFDAEQPFTP